MAHPINLLVVLVVLLVAFGLVERLWPAVPKLAAIRRPGFLLDLVYWFFNPMVTRAVTGFCAAMVVFSLIRVSDMDIDQLRLHGFGPVAHQPGWLIVFEMLLLGDLIGYWSHRAFHYCTDLWDIHAIHHSSVQLDWLSSVRVHPLNDIISKTIRVVPFVFLGFPLTAVVAYLPMLTIFAIFIHANVPWRFGLLRFVIASPAFHRWHHTSADEGLNCNFAGLFPFLDLAFGTFYMPDRQPTRFGVDERISVNFFEQLVYPFRPDRRDAASGVVGQGESLT